MPKQNQEQEHASEYSLKTFPKRDRPANFIIELVPHSESIPPLRDLSPEALEDALKYIGCVKPSLSPRDCSIYLQYLGIDLEPSRIEEYASHWFTQSSSLHYGEDHMLHMDSRRFFLPSSIQDSFILMLLSEWDSPSTPHTRSEIQRTLAEMGSQDESTRECTLVKMCEYLQKTKGAALSLVNSRAVINILMGSRHCEEYRLLVEKIWNRLQNSVCYICLIKKNARCGI